MAYSFVLTGGGTGGHVFPALAVADVLRARGHRILYVGTLDGIEARLVKEAGHDMQYVRAGALNRVGLRRQINTAIELPRSVWSSRRILSAFAADAIFSMGGFVAGPIMAAALWARVPLVVMEPNAIPGFANRRVARYVFRALLSFPSTARWFPRDRSEVTGLPVRADFFRIPRRSATDQQPFTVLLTGGSRGARTINRAARESWEYFRSAGSPVRLVLQSGASEAETLAQEFAKMALEGQVVPFLKNMPQAFAEADLVVGRAGAGALSEIAAAGMAAILVPFPFAADDHQLKNAELMVSAGAALMILDKDLSGERLCAETEKLRANPELLNQLRRNVKQFARPGAAERAANVLEEAAGLRK